jgi:hypothetical protein
LKVEREVITSDRNAERRSPSSATRDLARKLLNDALTEARKKLKVGDKDRHLSQLLQNPDFLEALNYALACLAAKELAQSDQRVSAIYVYHPSANADGEAGEALPLEKTTYLIVHVDTPSPSLKMFIASLDIALTASLRELPSEVFKNLASWLDCRLISEEDAQRDRGIAALHTSVFTRPLRVWPRDVR